MKAGGNNVKVVYHFPTHSREVFVREVDALVEKVEKGVTEKVDKVYIWESSHLNTHHLISHQLKLEYETSKGTFLFCKAGGENFKNALQKLKSCRKGDK